MSDLEFVGKMNPKPFISFRKEEELRIKEIKERLTKSIKESKKVIVEELNYERDTQEN